MKVALHILGVGDPRDSSNRAWKTQQKVSSAFLTIGAFNLTPLREVRERSEVSFVGGSNCLLHPHLARAGFIASRLGLERAQAAVSTLEAMGVPAATLTRTGRVLAANRLLETVGETILPIAFGGLAIASASANNLFQNAIGQWPW